MYEVLFLGFVVFCSFLAIHGGSYLLLKERRPTIEDKVVGLTSIGVGIFTACVAIITILDKR